MYDRSDIAIAKCLEDNPKATLKDISKITGLTLTPIWCRIRKLEHKKIIRRKVEIDWEALGVIMES